MSSLSRTERLLTTMEIKDLLVRERYYRDTQQWDKLRNSYHSDASKTNIKISWYNGDIAGFVKGSQHMATSGASSAHTITPVEVYLNGNKALTESTGCILARFTHKGVPYDCVSYSRFVSRLVHEGDEWRLLTLECIYDKDLIQPVVPGSAAAASGSIEVEETPRTSYRCLAWVLSQHGFEIDTNLPGTDMPGSGEKLIEAGKKWLEM